MPCSIPVAGCLLAALSITLVGSVAADAPDIERFLRIRTPGQATVAPDGTLYVRDWPDGVFQLFRVDGPAAGQDHPTTQLTHFPDGLSAFEVSPCGTRILLMHNVGGNENMQISLLDPKGNRGRGAILPVLADPLVRHGFSGWLHDSSGFLYSANADSANDFHVYRFNFSADPFFGESVDGVGSSTRILAESGMWSAADITRDGGRALLSRFRSASDSTIHELDVATGTLTDLHPAVESTEPSTFSASLIGYMPDEKHVLFASDYVDGTMRVFLRNLASGAISSPLPSLDAFMLDSASMNAERTLLAVVTNEGGYGSPHLFRLPDFTPIRLPQMERGIAGFGSMFGNSFTMTLSNARTPGLAFAVELDGDRANPARQITFADDQGIDLRAFPLPELITYTAFDGLEIPAFLFLPPDHEPGTPIPFVVNYHGGPEGQFRPGFNALAQYLMAHGFGIMQPNVRGSAGYGREFLMMDDYRKRWDSVRDGVDAAEWLVSRGYARPGKIATWGGSYGGYMSMATLVEDRKRVERGDRDEPIFGAGVNVVGIVNLQTFLEKTAGYRRQLREAEYGPLSDPEFLASVSPMTNIDLIQVPVFIAHGFNDPRVPVEEAMQLAVALKDRGFNPWVFIAPDEGHGFAKLENRLYYGRRLSAFLRQHLN